MAGAEGSADGTGPAARFSYPAGVAADNAGTLYVADANNHTIRKITSAGVVTTLAGTAGTGGATDGTGPAARFYAPSALTVDSAGNVYVADTYNRTIRKVTSAGVVTTIAGTAGLSGSTDATGAAARFSGPYGITLDGAGNIYVADTSNHTIRKIDSARSVTTLAGTAGSSGALDGTGAAARFNQPYGIASDGAGNLYVTDTTNHLVRKVTTLGVVTTVAGSGTGGSADGTGVLATFNRPIAVALTSAGDLIVADYHTHILRKVTTGGVVTTLAGTPDNAGSTDGFANMARFNRPSGIAVVGTELFYVVDANNFTLRQASTSTVAAPLITTQPTDLTVNVTKDATFTVTGSGAPVPTFLWQRQAAGTVGFVALDDIAPYSGVNTATLTITAATLSMSGDQFRCIAANGVSPEATSNAATLTVTQAPLFISEANTSFTIGTAGSFIVRATGTPAPTLSVSGLPTGYTFDPVTGILAGTPMSFAGSPFTLTFTASNTAGTATQNLVIRVMPVPGIPTITTQPTNQVIALAGTAVFSVLAIGNPYPTYTWQRQPTGTTGYLSLAEGGNYLGTATATLSVVGVNTSMQGDKFRCLITNPNGIVLTNEVVLGITVAPSITSANSADFVSGQAGTFTVTANGVPAPTFSAVGIPSWASLNPTTGVITGTPPNQTGSPFTIALTAANGVGRNSTQVFTLTVLSGYVAPTITSANSTNFIYGQSGSFTVTATGIPAPNFGVTGLPTWASIGMTSGVISGTPTSPVSTRYSLLVTASNSVEPAANQTFTLTVLGAPIFFDQPTGKMVEIGRTVTFSANAIGCEPLVYQWKKDGLPIAGATADTFSISNARLVDAGMYSVLVSNGLGMATSSEVLLTVLSGTQVVLTGYVPGGSANVGCTIQYSGTISSLGVDILLPSGWSYSSGSDEPETKPQAGDTGTLGWTYTTVPTSPTSFSYTLNVPQNEIGNPTIAGTVTLSLPSGDVYSILLKPDPLIVVPAIFHSADTDKDGKIGVSDLTRVIQLYNTRLGAVRTGCYLVESSSPDGFNPDLSRGTATAVTLTKYHSADYDRNGRLSVQELTRVIQLYNTREGASRTGKYHQSRAGDSEHADGFAPGQ